MLKQGQRVRVLTNRIMWVYWVGGHAEQLGDLRGQVGTVRRRDREYLLIRLDTNADIALLPSELERVALLPSELEKRDD